MFRMAGPVFFFLIHFDQFVLNQNLPWLVLCLHCIIVKQTEDHVLAGISLRLCITLSCTLVALCGLRHENNNNMSHGSEELKCLIDFWADKHISQT